MTLHFRCLCGERLKTPDVAAGRIGRCPNCGFWLKIPSAPSADTIAEMIDPPASGLTGKLTGGLQPHTGGSDAKKGRVVLADAQEEHRKNHLVMLRNHGYTVMEAVDGPTAVRTIHTCLPDAAIIDVHLEIQNGFHVMEQIRDPGNPASKKCWSIPIMVTSSRFSGRDQQYALHLGAYACFLKPLMPAIFCPKLEKAILEYRRKYG